MSRGLDRSLRILNPANELNAVGDQVRFYCYVQERRAVCFGLPARCHVASPPWLAPVLLLARLLHQLCWQGAGYSNRHRAVDPLMAVPRESTHDLVCWRVENDQDGVDMLVKFMLERAAGDMWHVGATNEAELPDAAWFDASGSVAQARPPDRYPRASCPSLPSRQEGFGLVMVLAFANVCSAIGSGRTSARGLQTLIDDSDCVKVTPVDDVPTFVGAIEALTDTDAPHGLDPVQRAASVGAHTHRVLPMCFATIWTSAQVPTAYNN